MGRGSASRTTRLPALVVATTGSDKAPLTLALSTEGEGICVAELNKLAQPRGIISRPIHGLLVPRTARLLGFWSGLGLVASNMIGAGVLLSAGFMAQDLGPGLLLSVWVAAGIVALAGTAAYSEISRLIPRSGGEY